jgi:hypothetical protein
MSQVAGAISVKRKSIFESIAGTNYFAIAKAAGSHRRRAADVAPVGLASFQPAVRKSKRQCSCHCPPAAATPKLPLKTAAGYNNAL